MELNKIDFFFSDGTYFLLEEQIENKQENSSSDEDRRQSHRSMILLVWAYVRDGDYCLDR